MAPKKAEEITTTNNSRDAGLKNAMALIQKQFGKESILTFTSSARQDIDYVSSGSLSLDWALGGKGYPKGRIVELFSEPSAGKTTLCLHAVAEVQKQGGKAAYFDLENALDLEYAKKLGVKVDELIFSQPSCGEDALEMANILMQNNAVDIVVFDSVAAMIPRAELEGQIGDSFIGTTARLLSQGLKKIAQSAARSNCLVMFVNQTRLKIGVMYGCFSYKSKVLLEDGSTACIGTLVNNKEKVRVLSYNDKTGKIEPKPIVNWFRNGKPQRVINIVAEKPYDNGLSRLEVLDDHVIPTPNGETRASELNIGDLIYQKTPAFIDSDLSSVIIGSILGDGSIRASRSKLSAQLRVMHGYKQTSYCQWKRSLFPDEMIGHAGLDYLNRYSFETKYFRQLYQHVQDKKKKPLRTIRKELCDKIDLFAVAIWYLDDGNFSGCYKKWGKGKSRICARTLDDNSKKMICDQLEKIGLPRPTCDKVGFIWYGENSYEFQSKIAKYVPSCMKYKIHPKIQVLGDTLKIKQPKIIDVLDTVKIKKIKVSTAKARKNNVKFDIEVKDNHNYFVDGVLVHNSPLTTSGGEALKFYASQRLHITRTMKPEERNGEAIGNETKVKVVKNKVAPPFKVAEFMIEYNKGISINSEIFKLGMKFGLIEKAGSFYSYEPEQFRCQGEAKFKEWLDANPEIKEKIIAKIKEKIAGTEAEAVMETEPEEAE